MSSMLEKNGAYTLANVHECKVYGGHMTDKSQNRGSIELYSFFRYQFHGKRAENNNRNIVRSSDRNIIIRVAFFYGGLAACSEARTA